MVIEKPLVSVIIPAFNASRFIASTLDSVVNQTYRNLEILVVDDGSSDETPDIVCGFSKKDKRVHLLQKVNSGVADARNLGLQHSQGDFVAPIDADDIWMPNNIEKQVDCMIRSPVTVGMVYAWSFNIDEQDNMTGGFHVSWWKGNVYLPFICRNFVGNASAVLIRRSCLENVGGYDSSFRKQSAQGCEDLDLYLRIAASYQINVVPEFLVGYRQVGGSMSRNSQAMEKSQQLVLRTVYDKSPDLFKKVKPWSMRNYYAYLANQSHHSGQFEVSQEWLTKALKEDFWMTILGHDTYVLSILNWLHSRLRREEAPQSSSTFKSRFKTFLLSKRFLLCLAVVKECFPARLYERFRIKQLLAHTPQALALAVGRNAL